MKLRIVEVPDGRFAVQIKRRFWFGWDFLGVTHLLAKYLSDKTIQRGGFGMKVYPPFAFIPTKYETLSEAAASAERFRKRVKREKVGPVVIKELFT